VVYESRATTHTHIYIYIYIMHIQPLPWSHRKFKPFCRRKTHRHRHHTTHMHTHVMCVPAGRYNNILSKDFYDRRAGQRHKGPAGISAHTAWDAAQKSFYFFSDRFDLLKFQRTKYLYLCYIGNIRDGSHGTG